MQFPGNQSKFCVKLNSVSVAHFVIQTFEMAASGQTLLAAGNSGESETDQLLALVKLLLMRLDIVFRWSVSEVVIVFK